MTVITTVGVVSASQDNIGDAKIEIYEDSDIESEVLNSDFENGNLSKKSIDNLDNYIETDAQNSQNKLEKSESDTLNSAAKTARPAPKLLAKKTTFKSKIKTKKYAVSLKSDNKGVKNAKVFLKIGKKSFTAKTNSKGKAIFKITKLTKKGTYAGDIKFRGTGSYSPISQNLKVKITKSKFKIAPLNTKTVSSSDSVKASSEDINTNPISPSPSQINSSSNNTFITDDDEFVDVSEAYKYLNDFRNESGVWYWNSDDVTKTYFNTDDSNKLTPLERDEGLEEAAKLRAKELVEKYSHTRPDGTRFWTAYPSTLLSYGENIAAGQQSSLEVSQAWREDDFSYSGQSHRRNMLSLKFNCVGIAGFKVDGIIYWVQAFGKR